MDFRTNQLSGKMPDAFCFMSSLKDMHFQANHLSGQIPDTLASVASLKLLGFSKNCFSGKIPDALAFMASVLGSVGLRCIEWCSSSQELREFYIVAAGTGAFQTTP